MTKYDEIKAELNALSKAVSDKGYAQVASRASFYEDAKTHWVVEYKDAANAEVSIHTYDDCPVEALKKARARCHLLQPLADTKQEAFNRQLSKLIDAAREMDIGAKFLNPLETLMHDLSENIIEGPK